jgi:hypothetical protein
MAALEDAADKLTGDHVLWLNFDTLLAQPETGLRAIADFFGLSAEADRIADITRGPLMRRYSKALDHEFGPEARILLLQDAGATHAAAIQSALAMLQQASDKVPALARALARSNLDC